MRGVIHIFLVALIIVPWHDGDMGKEPENFEVKNPPVEWILRNMGNKLKDQLPDHMGFMLLIFDYGENGSTFYISSADRSDVIKMMREFINKQEKYSGSK